MIIPTIGRKVWFWSKEAREDNIDQAEDATVIYVHTPSLVALRVTSHKGETRFEEQVFLIPSDSPQQSHHTDYGDYAVWMPYQIGQVQGSGASKG